MNLSRPLHVLGLLLLSALFPGAAPAWRGLPAALAGPPPPALSAGATWTLVILDEPALATRLAESGAAADRATDHARRRRLDDQSPAARAWLARIAASQEAFLARLATRVGHPLTIGDRYTHALNGFAVRLTAAEAARAQGLPGLRLLQAETWQRPATDAGPAWSGAATLWNGSVGDVGRLRGEGQVIGIIDTGINIDHPSFAAVAADGYEHANPRGHYLDWCDPASADFDPALACNDKLIGLWSHPSVRGARPKASPEDENGHGTHTASTAAGNPVTAVLGPGGVIQRAISGVAPRANLVAYDACSGEGCPDTATVAAIEQATRDGVDVINYSITTYAPGTDDPSSSPWRNAVNLAFLGAREAGIAVVVAAGNAGSGPGSLTSNAPWTLTVANASHNRAALNGLAQLSGGASAPPGDLAGRAFSGAYGPAPIVLAQGVRNARGDVDTGICAEAFAPGTWHGEIVVCDRGVVARVAKGANVLAGGAGGMVLANLGEGESLAADEHVLPATHIGRIAGDQLRAWVATGRGHRGRILATTINLDPANGDIMNASSSRGPASAASCCRRPGMATLDLRLMALLKPDLSAPGTDILAAIASADDRPAPEFGLMSGTSMASPHVAGAAALLRQARPAWSPAELQSALVLAARDGTLRKEDGASPADRFDGGGGHLDVGAAAMAGLVLDLPPAVFRAVDPDEGGFDSLNLPGLVSVACVGECSWERTVTAGAGPGGTWTAIGQSEGLWLSVSVEPASFTLAPGASQRLRITAKVTDAAEGWRFGRVLLEPQDSAAGAALHLPLAARALRLDPPPPVLITTLEASGRRRIAWKAAEPQGVRVTGFGLTPANVEELSLPEAPPDDNPFAPADGRWQRLITVPPGASRVVVETTRSTARDVDLWLGRDVDGDGLPAAEELRCHGQGSGWRELCEVMAPQAGRWWTVVQNSAGSPGTASAIGVAWAVVGDGPSADQPLDATAAAGTAGPFDLDLILSWRLPHLAPGERSYGAIGYGEPSTAGNPGGLVAVDLVGGTEVLPTATVASATATATTPPPTAGDTARPGRRLWLPFLQDLGARP